MKKYEIQSVMVQDDVCRVSVKYTENQNVELGDLTMSGKGITKKTIELPISAAEKLKVGKNIFVLENKISEDYVYLYRDGVCFKVKPASDDKYSCKCYIKNLPGVFDSKLDKAVLKVLLLCECKCRDIRVSLIAWRNLQRLFLHKGLSTLEKN
jgi:hypothetical protein